MHHILYDEQVFVLCYWYTILLLRYYYRYT